MFTPGETVGLAEWIIDDTCLVKFALTIKICPALHLDLINSSYLQSQSYSR